MKLLKMRTSALALALLTVVMFAVAGQALADGSNDRFDTTGPAALPAGCFAQAIDTVISDFDAAVETWAGCLTDDYTLEFVFFPGGPSIVCPGPNCPIQTFSSRADLRAQFAGSNFQANGYLATQHQLSNVLVERLGALAVVSSVIQANHFKPDNSVDIFWGDYTATAVRERRVWKIQREVITGTSFLNFAGVPVTN